LRHCGVGCIDYSIYDDYADHADTASCVDCINWPVMWSMPIMPMRSAVLAERIMLDVSCIGVVLVVSSFAFMWSISVVSSFAFMWSMLAMLAVLAVLVVAPERVVSAVLVVAPERVVSAVLVVAVIPPERVVSCFGVVVTLIYGLGFWNNAIIAIMRFSLTTQGWYDPPNHFDRDDKS